MSQSGPNAFDFDQRIITTRYAAIQKAVKSIMAEHEKASPSPIRTLDLSKPRYPTPPQPRAASSATTSAAITEQSASHRTVSSKIARNSSPIRTIDLKKPR